MVSGWDRPGLAAVVRGGFGVNEEAVDLGAVKFEGIFELGDDLVDAGHGEIVRQSAMAVDLDTVGAVVVGAGDEDLVNVEDLGEGGGDAAEADFELAVAVVRGGPLDGGRFAFDVGEDGGDLGDVAADVRFKLRDEGVGCGEGHLLVDLEVLLDVELVVELLHGDVVDVEVGAGGNGADAVVNAFGEGCGGDGMDDDVGSGEMAADGGGGCEGDLLGALEGEVAGHAEGDVGEVVWAGAAGAYAVDGEDAVDAGKVANDVAGLGAGFRWRGVGEGVDGPAGERPGDVEDDEGDEDGSDGVGELERGDVPVHAGVGCGQAEENGEGRPDVGAEVEGIGGEGFAAGIVGDALELVGTGEVYGDGEEKGDEWPDREGEG
jgi:hypothetical protein